MGRKRRSGRGQGREGRPTLVNVDINREVAYIVGRAGHGEARFVSFGSLVLFSTPGGDAWMLDPEEGLALRLARDGSPLPVRIEETEEAFAVSWDGRFRIEGDVFLAADQAGLVAAFEDYPITSILEAIRRATSHQPPG